MYVDRSFATQAESDRSNGLPRSRIAIKGLALLGSGSLSIHVVLTFLFIKLTLLLGSCILVLLVLRDKIVHVRLSLSELHLVHTLTSVPMKECLATEHGCEEL